MFFLMAIGQTSTAVLAILDDDESVQIALQDLIESGGLSARCFGSAEQFLNSTARHYVSCLITDVGMPGMSGLELQAKLKSEKCSLPIIFITARGDIPMAVRAIQGGAVDFLTKPVDGAALFNSVEKAFEQERANRREATEQEAFAARYATLTPREREVLALITEGLGNAEIAARLSISEKTVRNHVSNVFDKLGVWSRAQAMVFAHDHGFRA